MAAQYDIHSKRIYDKPDEGDGFRILVDRLWPRGISKQEARIDLWMKDIAPSDDLRKWFAHDPAKWTAFSGKYRAELERKKELAVEIIEIVRSHKRVTLLYAASDKEHNNAVVLLQALKIGLSSTSRGGGVRQS